MRPELKKLLQDLKQEDTQLLYERVQRWIKCLKEDMPQKAEAFMGNITTDELQSLLATVLSGRLHDLLFHEEKLSGPDEQCYSVLDDLFSFFDNKLLLEILKGHINSLQPDNLSKSIEKFPELLTTIYERDCYDEHSEYSGSFKDLLLDIHEPGLLSCVIFVFSRETSESTSSSLKNDMLKIIRQNIVLESMSAISNSKDIEFIHQKLTSIGNILRASNNAIFRDSIWSTCIDFFPKFISKWINGEISNDVFKTFLTTLYLGIQYNYPINKTAVLRSAASMHEMVMITQKELKETITEQLETQFFCRFFAYYLTQIVLASNENSKDAMKSQYSVFLDLYEKSESFKRLLVNSLRHYKNTEDSLAYVLVSISKTATADLAYINDAEMRKIDGPVSEPLSPLPPELLQRIPSVDSLLSHDERKSEAGEPPVTTPNSPGRKSLLGETFRFIGSRLRGRSNSSLSTRSGEDYGNGVSLNSLSGSQKS